MRDKAGGSIRELLDSLLSEIERAHHLTEREQRVSGGRCRLDAETFDLLTRNFRSGEYSKGILEAYSKVIGVTQPRDLQHSSQVVRRLRSEIGGHIVQISILQSELDEVKKAATRARLTVPALLESCTYLYVRVGLS